MVDSLWIKSYGEVGKVYRRGLCYDMNLGPIGYLCKHYQQWMT